MDIPKDAAECEAFFRNAIKMTLKNKFPWTILTLIVDQMSPTINEAKELVKVLLNELQILQKKHKERVLIKCGQLRITGQLKMLSAFHQKKMQTTFISNIDTDNFLKIWTT